MPTRANVVPKPIPSQRAARRVERSNGSTAGQPGRLANADSLEILAASIAHEVNQPLSGILSNASACLRMLCADPPNIEGARDTARRTIRDVNRAADVVSRLRSLFARTTLATELVDLNEAVSGVLASSRCELEASGVIVNCRLADRLPLVTGDRVALQQVILNLIRNAAEAMAGLDDLRRELVIATQRLDDDQLLLSVRDVGTGFRREDAIKLFTPFYTTKDRGMGIGLSVSRSIVEAHCGRLWGEPNEDGAGATFWVSIPYAPARSTLHACAGRDLAGGARAVASTSGA